MRNIGRHIEIRGVVQGVGFRPWVYQLAARDGVTGRVRNDSAGVIIDAFGSDEAIDAFMAHLGAGGPPAAQIRELEWQPIPFENASEFSIVASETAEERNISIPPDLATCDDCLDDIFDPKNRRFLYPFTNCTNCGPRYTIVRDVPYDREKTTMSSFGMCADCRREYEDPLDRRFHAQPNACPVCGPQLVAVDPQGREIATDLPIHFAARALRASMTVAVKGLGGFHLACDATSSMSVVRLRDRKRREAKPLAVMVRDLDQAERVAELTDEDRALLSSVERPIVLVPRRKDARLAPEIAGENPLLGLLLPYTPLHHILLREAGVPLVMTSGNTTDEPMAVDNDEALERLGQIADIFLMHNRRIETRADDSVVRVIAGAPTMLRRARGYVPRGVELKHAFVEPVLAVGAQLKNAICIGAGHRAFLGPHVGDLETFETLRSFEASVEQLKNFIGVAPRVVAHDLHPDYFSTRFAQSLEGVELVPVQHHHAHVASAMAEHGLDGTVVGVAYDGTGYGPDGTSWGGEILVASLTGFTRFATFRPIRLAGGDQAIRNVWRIALALLDDAFEGAPPLNAIPLFRPIDRLAVSSIRRMIERNFNSPQAHGVGRYFDAFGAICLSKPDARYEGEVALLWNMAADANEQGRYEVVVREGTSPWEIDPRPMVKAAVLDLIGGVDPSIISARFHNTLAEVTIEIARAASEMNGNAQVVLTGGCFQNARLAEHVLRGIPGALMNHDIPPGDGGLALGQALVANAVILSRADGEGPPAEARDSRESGYPSPSTRLRMTVPKEPTCA
ncbi:MAG: carbamoyltransferase HypF [Thermoanaerobaculia bacterium]